MNRIFLFLFIILLVPLSVQSIYAQHPPPSNEPCGDWYFKSQGGQCRLLESIIGNATEDFVVPFIVFLPIILLFSALLYYALDRRAKKIVSPILVISALLWTVGILVSFIAI